MLLNKWCILYIHCIKIVQLSGVECFSHMYHIGIAECTLIGLDVKQLLLCCFLNARYLACVYNTKLPMQLTMF